LAVEVTVVSVVNGALEKRIFLGKKLIRQRGGEIVHRLSAHPKLFDRARKESRKADTGFSGIF